MVSNMSVSNKILVVDDVLDNIQVAMNILKEESYDLSYATSAQEALELVAFNHFDLILLDIMMPKIDGFQVCKRIKQLPHYDEVPIIFLTGRSDIDSISKGFAAGGVDYITKPFHAEELLNRVHNHLELYISKKTLKANNLKLSNKNEILQQRLIKEVEDNQREIIYVLMEMMEFASDETGRHIKRVAEMSQLLARYTDYLNHDDELLVYHAAPMHDIGKVAIPREILHKPGKLTEEEYEVIKTHAERGAEFLQHSDRRLFKAAAVIAEQHHEKWDGSGYPKGLAGTDIHAYGRIVALADVFDALSHRRCYKEGWPIEEAVEYIKSQSGKHFDPSLVDVFVTHIDEFIAIGQQ